MEEASRLEGKKTERERNREIEREGEEGGGAREGG